MSGGDVIDAAPDRGCVLAGGAVDPTWHHHDQFLAAEHSVAPQHSFSFPSDKAAVKHHGQRTGKTTVQQLEEARTARQTRILQKYSHLLQKL